MQNSDIAFLLQVFMLAWLAVLAAVVTIQALRGDLHMGGMLRARDRSRRGRIDPERVAMLFVTVAVMGGYALSALAGEPSFNEQSGRARLPDIPEMLLALLAGGNATYLAGKISRR